MGTTFGDMSDDSWLVNKEPDDIDDLIDSLLEERYLPRPAPVMPLAHSGVDGSLEGVWVMGQVFRTEKKPNERFYYMAQKKDQEWYVLKCSYQVVNGAYAVGSEIIDRHPWENSRSSFLSALERVAQLDKEYQDTHKDADIDGLRGNYFTLANRFGYHLDDNRKLFKLSDDKAVTQNAVFLRESFRVAYKAEGAAEAVNFTTWDDVYSKIIHKHAATHETQMTEFMKDTSFIAVLKRGSIINNDTLPPPQEDFLEDVFNTTKLLKALRKGGDCYRILKDSNFTDTLFLARLETARNDVVAIARNDLGFSEAQAKQLSGVMTSGRDPYAEQPLPLTFWTEKFAAASAAQPTAPKKPKPSF
jgi:hypothetical protein